MKLYFSPGACSLATHIVLRETGLAFDSEKVSTKTHQTASGADFYGINSKGQVPFLVLDDGTTLSEGPIIAQYIADQAPQSKLMPAAGTIARYKAMEWQNYVTSELHKSFGPLFNPAFDAAARTLLLAALRKKYDWLDGQLAAADYLTGATFTAADAYLFTVTNWAKHVGLDLDDLANVQAFMKRVAARPAVQEAMKVEGLLG